MGTIENLIFSFLNFIADNFVNVVLFAIGVYVIFIIHGIASDGSWRLYLYSDVLSNMVFAVALISYIM